MRILYLVLILPIILISCKTTNTTPDNYTERQLHFGKGGGFAGTVDQYILLENGAVFDKSISGEYVKLNDISHQYTEQIFNNYYILDIHKKKINNPGNIYYYIQMNDGSATNKIVWNDQRNDNNLQLFFDNLMSLVTKDN